MRKISLSVAPELHSRTKSREGVHVSFRRVLCLLDSCSCDGVVECILQLSAKRETGWPWRHVRWKKSRRQYTEETKEMQSRWTSQKKTRETITHPSFPSVLHTAFPAEGTFGGTTRKPSPLACELCRRVRLLTLKVRQGVRIFCYAR